MELLKCSKFQRKKTKRSKRFFYHKSHNIISMLWKRVYGSLASTSNCKIIFFFWIRKISVWLFHCNSSHIKPIKIPKDYKPSSKVLAMTCGPLPKDFDLDQELDKMWEERAKWMCFLIQMSLLTSWGSVKIWHQLSLCTKQKNKKGFKTLKPFLFSNLSH